MKNFKALDNIRNTEIGHIQIDYRIACAMINFLHKPCCPDGEKASIIAERMKEKSKTEINHLEFFLEKKKQLNTKYIYPIDINEINDFPKLMLKELKEEIFFGSFQYNQSKSYYADIIEEGKAYIVCDELLKDVLKDKNNFPNSKIIAIEVVSRHRRSETKKETKKNVCSNRKKQFKNNYKVFIHYISDYNHPNSIKGTF